MCSGKKNEQRILYSVLYTVYLRDPPSHFFLIHWDICIRRRKASSLICICAGATKQQGDDGIEISAAADGRQQQVQQQNMQQQYHRAQAGQRYFIFLMFLSQIGALNTLIIISFLLSSLSVRSVRSIVLLLALFCGSLRSRRLLPFHPTILILRTVNSERGDLSSGYDIKIIQSNWNTTLM